MIYLVRVTTYDIALARWVALGLHWVAFATNGTGEKEACLRRYRDIRMGLFVCEANFVVEASQHH